MRPIAHSQWHLDEMVVSIAGRRMYMWRAVDSEGEVLEVLVQPRRDKAATVRLIKKLLKRHGLLHSSRREIHRTASAFHAGEAYLFGNSERLGRSPRLIASEGSRLLEGTTGSEDKVFAIEWPDNL